MNYTIQISIYNWAENQEEIYEAKVKNLGEYYELTKNFSRSVKVRKPTDKNWYYVKTLAKRLFKEDLSYKPETKLVMTNNLDQILKLKEEEKAKEEAKEMEKMAEGKELVEKLRKEYI